MRDANSTNDTLSNDIKVNGLLTLTLNSVLKMAFSDSVATGAQCFKNTCIFSFVMRILCTTGATRGMILGSYKPM